MDQPGSVVPTGNLTNVDHRTDTDAPLVLFSPSALRNARDQSSLLSDCFDGDELFGFLDPLRIGKTLLEIEASGSQIEAIRTWLYDFAAAYRQFIAMDQNHRDQIADWSELAGFAFAELLRPDGFNRSFSLSRWAQSFPSTIGSDQKNNESDPKDSHSTDDSDLLAEIFAETGPLAAGVPGYETRWAQVELAKAVSDALENQTTLIAEAGTGVGKSLGYLIPAILWASDKGGRVVVSTHTKSLQDQLYKKDLPVALDAAFSIQPGKKIRTALLRGRGNYLCRDRWKALTSAATLDPELAGLVARLSIWVNLTDTGDLTELSLTESESRALRRLTAIEENCPFDRCRALQGNRCFLTKARNNARAANVLLVNHALLLTEIDAESHVLTDCSGLIVDEAHHLEGVATGQLSFRLTQTGLDSLMKEFVDLKGQSIEGLAAVAVRAIGAIAEPVIANESLTRLRDSVLQKQATETRIVSFFDALFEVVEKKEGQRSGNTRHRILAADRAGAEWSDLEIVWESVQESLVSLQNVATWLAATLRKLLRDSEQRENEELVLASLETWIESLTLLMNGASEIVHYPAENRVSWVETGGFTPSASLSSAPILVGDDLGSLFDNDRRAVVLTSATLATGGTFSLLRNQLSLEDGEELVLPSPFDQTASTLVVLPVSCA